MKQQMAIADTHIAVNGCQVLVGHLNPAHATATAKEFKHQLGRAISRAGCVNMSDFYSAYIRVNEIIEAGEALCN